MDPTLRSANALSFLTEYSLEAQKESMRKIREKTQALATQVRECIKRREDFEDFMSECIAEGKKSISRKLRRKFDKFLDDEEMKEVVIKALKQHRDNANETNRDLVTKLCGENFLTETARKVCQVCANTGRVDKELMVIFDQLAELGQKNLLILNILDDLEELVKEVEAEVEEHDSS